MADIVDAMYRLRDMAGVTADKLRGEIAEAQAVLDKLDKFANEAESAAELVASSDLFPNMSANIPADSGLMRATGEHSHELAYAEGSGRRLASDQAKKHWEQVMRGVAALPAESRERWVGLWLDATDFQRVLMESGVIGEDEPSPAPEPLPQQAELLRCRNCGLEIRFSPGLSAYVHECDEERDCPPAFGSVAAPEDGKG